MPCPSYKGMRAASIFRLDRRGLAAKRDYIIRVKILVVIFNAFLVLTSVKYILLSGLFADYILRVLY